MGTIDRTLEFGKDGVYVTTEGNGTNTSPIKARINTGLGFTGFLMQILTCRPPCNSKATAIKSAI
jgi:hypothetical protein